jgi:hypothetical protein
MINILLNVSNFFYQSPNESLDELFQVCGRIEQKGWGTVEVAEALVKFFRKGGEPRKTEELGSDVIEFFHAELD